MKSSEKNFSGITKTSVIFLFLKLGGRFMSAIIICFSTSHIFHIFLYMNQISHNKNI